MTSNQQCKHGLGPFVLPDTCPHCHIEWLHTALRRIEDRSHTMSDADDEQALFDIGEIANRALSGEWPAVETTDDDQLVQDTIAQNTRLLSVLTKVTESWVNGRRVLDGIPAIIAHEAREAFKLRPTVEPSGAATICGHPECDNDSVLGECNRPPEKPAGALPPAFQSLLDLQPNWDSYGAKRINLACVQKAYEIWKQLAGTWLPVPHSDGTVGLEQHQGGFDIEIDVDLALPPEKATAVTPGVCCCRWDKDFSAILHRDRTCSVHGDATTQVNGGDKHG